MKPIHPFALLLTLVLSFPAFAGETVMQASNGTEVARLLKTDCSNAKVIQLIMEHAPDALPEFYDARMLLEDGEHHACWRSYNNAPLIGIIYEGGDTATIPMHAFGPIDSDAPLVVPAGLDKTSI